MRDDDTLPRELEEAVDALRETPSVSQEWIDSIAARAADDRLASIRYFAQPRRWSIRPWIALAAGVACIAMGATGMYIALERRSPDRNGPPAMAARTEPVRFSIVAPGAVTVQLVGDFNAWNPAALPMRRSRDGATWEVEVGLHPGRYTYAFVVDGRLARDPSAAQSPGDDFGVPSSVLLVKGGGT
jgi:hypothetical protein